MEPDFNFWAWQIWSLTAEELQIWREFIFAVESAGSAGAADVVGKLPPAFRGAGSRPPAVFQKLDDHILALAIQKSFFKDDAWQGLYHRWWFVLSCYFAKCLGIRVTWGSRHRDTNAVDDRVDELIAVLFAKLSRNGFKNYDGLRPLSRFIWTAAKHVRLDAQGGRGALTGGPVRELRDDGIEDPGTGIDDPMLIEIVEKARERMSEAEREVFDVRLQGGTNPEIAEELNITTEAVALRWFHACQKFQRVYEEECFDALPPWIQNVHRLQNGDVDDNLKVEVGTGVNGGGEQEKGDGTHDVADDATHDEVVVTVMCPTFTASHLVIESSLQLVAPCRPKKIGQYRQLVEFRLKLPTGWRQVVLKPIASLNGTARKLTKKLDQHDYSDLLVGEPLTIKRNSSPVK